MLNARVENQRYQDKELVQYFSGSAEMHMDFTMLETPCTRNILYVTGKTDFY